MTVTANWRRIGLAALLACALACAAAAEDVTPQDASKDTPKDAPKAEEIPLKDCVHEDSDFHMHGKSPAFVIALTNKCEKRLRCKVNVNVTNAFGSAQGHATLLLAPHAAGAAATKTYSLKVKAMGGMAQSSRQCEAM